MIRYYNRFHGGLGSRKIAPLILSNDTFNFVIVVDPEKCQKYHGCSCKTHKKIENICF